ncbi:MAG: restriction endonuclease subunit S [Nitrospirae bacterium]|nr:restriction endonuclease subunit S [Nitrospirota bacterium]
MKDVKRELPKGWRWGRLRNEILNNISLFKKDVFAEDTFKYIDISSIDNVTKRITGYQELSVNDAPSRAKYILEENDIIVATVRPNLNAVAIVDKQYAGCVCSSGFCVVRLKNSHHSPYFFRYLTSPYFVDVVSAMVQGAMYPAINNHDVINFEIPLPPTIDDQIAIANNLEQKMADIEKMRQAALRQKEAVEAMPGAILREVFDFEM